MEAVGPKEREGLAWGGVTFVVVFQDWRGRHGFDSNRKRPAASRGPGLVGLVKKPIHQLKANNELALAA